MLLLNNSASTIFLSVLLLSSCAYQQEKINKKEVGRSTYEARWSDVPLPIDRVFDVKQTYQSVDQRACRFVITTQRSCADMISWYKRELEKTGWRINAQYQFSQSASFIADRPSKFLHIFMQELSSQQTHITILVGLKK